MNGHSPNTKAAHTEAVESERTEQHAAQFRAASLRLTELFDILLKEAPDTMNAQDVALVIVSASTKALIASHGVPAAVRVLRELATGLETEVTAAN
jgi:hypothetical protein